MEKVDNFIVQEIFSTIDECRLKVYDQIGDICYLEYNEAFKKGIELHWRCYEYIFARLWSAQRRNWRIWKKTGHLEWWETSHLKENGAIYFDYDHFISIMIRCSFGKKTEKNTSFGGWSYPERTTRTGVKENKNI